MSFIEQGVQGFICKRDLRIGQVDGKFMLLITQRNQPVWELVLKILLLTFSFDVFFAYEFDGNINFSVQMKPFSHCAEGALS